MAYQNLLTAKDGECTVIFFGTTGKDTFNVKYFGSPNDVQANFKKIIETYVTPSTAKVHIHIDLESVSEADGVTEPFS